ncbi:MAG: biotin--[acetyl-CoA-carboxylase] ligase [Nocardioides sp.]
MCPDAAPDRPPLDGSAVSLPAGFGLETYAELTSTNAEVVRRIRGGAGAAEGLVIAADYQSAGRGRLARRWEAPPRSALTFSVLLRPSFTADHWPWLSLLAGWAVASVLRAHGLDAGLKWPNDVLVGDHKVAGILVERIETEHAGPAAVVGIGLNVTPTAAELPVPTAASVSMYGCEVSREELLGEILSALAREYAEWSVSRLRAAYLPLCVTIGREIRAELPGGSALTGRATGIDGRGRLTLEVAATPGDRDVRTRVVDAGDVVHIRPAQ